MKRGNVIELGEYFLMEWRRSTVPASRWVSPKERKRRVVVEKVAHRQIRNNHVAFDASLPLAPLERYWSASERGKVWREEVWDQRQKKTYLLLGWTDGSSQNIVNVKLLNFSSSSDISRQPSGMWRDKEQANRRWDKRREINAGRNTALVEVRQRTINATGKWTIPERVLRFPTSQKHEDRSRTGKPKRKKGNREVTFFSSKPLWSTVSFTRCTPHI